MRLISFLRRSATVLAVAIASTTLLLGPWTEVAFAQPKEMPGKGASGGLPVVDPTAAASSVYNNILTQLTRAGVVALFNGAQTFFGQLAYDAANYVASGGKGQAAVFYKKGFGDYIKGVASDAMGDFVGSLSDGKFFKDIGFNLCQPSNPLTTLRIQVGIGMPLPGQQNLQRPKPKCDFKKIQSNWDSWVQTMSNTDVLDTLGKSFNMNTSDVGVAASIMGQSIYRQMDSADAAKSDRKEGNGFKAITDQISGRVRTPSSIVQDATKEEVIATPKQNQTAQVGHILSNAFEQGPVQLMLYTSSMFLNTLTSKMMKRIFEKGLGAFDFSDLETKQAVIGPDSIVTQGATDARRANIDLKTPNLQGNSTYEIISELIACPSGNRGTWNCTMDQALASALQQSDEQGAATVRSAIAKGQLHGDWKLIPAQQTRENQDPMCYTYGYCAGNLQKLRLARILPVGFEFAANSAENITRCGTAAGCITVAEVVSNFLNCNDQGERDTAHPWCHLIDPQWVITRIPQQCALNGYSENLMSDSLSQRRQECQDIQTCLKRNDKGECIGGYGYCLAERTAYRFGATECPDRFASCRNYTSRAGAQVSLLRNTLDYGVCNETNVGCQWYATVQVASTTPAVVWNEALARDRQETRQFMNAKMETCGAGGDGCTKLYRGSVGVASLNLILNPSFERHATDTLQLLENWTGSIPYAHPEEAGVVVAGEGYGLLDLTTSRTTTQAVQLAPSRMYTLSYYAKSVGSGASNAHVAITQRDAAGATAALGREYITPSCRVGAGIDAVATGASISSDWRQVFCSFQTTVATRSALIQVSGAGSMVDAMQLEEADAPTPFVDGVNTILPVVHLKLPPDELGCTGGPSDPPACEKYARVCTQLDAGCDGYSEKAGGTEIPAVLNTGDLCPASCVGYAEYRKQRSAFDLVYDADPLLSDPTDTTSTYFVPTTAVACTQAAVGCEEFTNVDALASGGEQKAYFTYVRSCEKPNTNSQTYFTWEGSDTAGFQLRTWSLIRDVASVPGAPRKLVKMSPGSSQYKPADSCNETLWRSGVDADCRQFYNAAGTVFYAYMSQTVLSTTSCTTYRLNRSNANDCLNTGGNFNVSTGECRYGIFATDSLTCSQAVVGCRAYAGASSGNIQTVYSTDFKTGVAGFTGLVATSNESLLVGDQSLRVNRNAGTYRTQVDVPTRPTDLIRATFWAKMPGITNAVLTLTGSAPDGTGSRTLGTVQLGSDWQKFSIGLFEGQAANTTTTLAFSVGGVSVPALFIDEVQVQTQNNLVYARMNSWNTPAECDATVAGIPEPQAMLGCRAYTNRRGDQVAIRQFQRLCKQEVIGCSAFVDTRNSEAVDAQTTTLPYQTFTRSVTGSGPTAVITTTPRDQTITVTHPADRMTYVIDELSKRCKPEEDSCRAFGLPIMKADRSGVDRYTTVYIKDDVTKYNTGLCRPSELYCDAFTAGAGVEYFKDPKTHVCEYKEQVQVGGRFGTVSVATGTYAGWFMKGVTPATPCYPAALASGSEFGIYRVDDMGYAGYGGLCGPQYGECTEFRDTNDKTDPLHVSGKPYFFIKNDQLDTSSCGGNVDTDKGCVLLRDLTDSSLRYNTQASYDAYQRAGYTPMAPINCADGLTNAACTRFTPALTTNDANLIVKVKKDRDCLQWLGCKSAETVFDPSQRRYIQVCTDIAMCDRATGSSDDKFCSGYVNRSTSTESMLPQGAYFDVNRYAHRSVKMGDKDYSGYALPNAFQIPDLVSMTVAKEGMGVARSQNLSGLGLDYRLAAVAMIPRINRAFVAPEANQATILCPSIGGSDARAGCTTGSISPVAQRYPDLYLCQHAGSGRIGFYKSSEVAAVVTGGIPCYLSVHGESSVFDFQNIQEKFALTNAKRDPQLSSAFPYPQCRSNPEADSPYGPDFVTRWDFSTNPPKPAEKLSGFTNAKVCEFGEDCECAYKRADYSQAAVTKFYAMNSPNVPPGVCQGGPRDGQSCIPDTVAKAPSVQSTRTAQGSDLVRAIEGSNQAQSCGTADQGGRCIPFSKVEIVRGVFGQCLEQDSTRNVGSDQSRKPCLTWNPNPVLFGDKDPYHYNPQAGYNPPQNSGQYYCLSEARQPETIHITYPYLMSAGGMSHISYDDEYTSDGDCVACGGNKVGGAIDGSTARGSETGNQCEYADDDQDDDDHEKDDNALRLISSGKDRGHSYVETFFPIKANIVALAMFKTQTAASSTDLITAATLDSNIGFFSIRPFKNSNGQGRMACGYQAGWVDGIASFNYDDADESKRADGEWHQKFMENYNPTMTRGSERVLTNTAGAPVQMPCVRTEEDAYSPYTDDEACYFKYWQTDYRFPVADPDAGNPRSPMAGEPFTGIFDATVTNPQSSFEDIRRSPEYRECTTDKPYFGIRAVFQAPVKNTVVPGGRTVARRDIQGPWRLAGFWTTTCSGQANDYRYIYTYVDMTSADVCSQLAEVKSKDTNQDAAYTDRVWKDAAYTVPGIGTQYNARFAPFSSALNTGPAGKDPLFQTGSMASGYSPLHPPTFLSSGADTYYRMEHPDPKDKWAYLTNIFARVYKVYRFNNEAVLKTDKACIQGPYKGVKCTTASGADGASQACSLNGVCKTDNLPVSAMKAVSVCNSMSGMNSGLLCNPRPDMCHIAPIDPRPLAVNGEVKPMLLPCEQQAGWSMSANGWSGPGHTNITQKNASKFGAFKCPDTWYSLRKNLACSGPSTASPECPMAVRGVCATTGDPATARAKAQGATRGVCQYYLPTTPSGAGYALPTAGGRLITAMPGGFTGLGRDAFRFNSTVGLPDAGSFQWQAAGADAASCYIDTDCSFTQRNFYLKGKYAYTSPPNLPLYSARSSYNLNPAGDAGCSTDPRAQQGWCLTSTFVQTNRTSGPFGTSAVGMNHNFIRGGTEGPSWWNAQNALIMGGGDGGLVLNLAGGGSDTYDISEFQRWPGVGMTNSPSREALGTTGDAATGAAEFWDGVLAVPGLGDVLSFFGLGASPRMQGFNLAACEPLVNFNTGPKTGKCEGGLKEGSLCRMEFSTWGPSGGTYTTPDTVGATYGCRSKSDTDDAPYKNSCGDVTRSAAPRTECLMTSGDPNALDPDKDNNACTHSAGYYPRLDLCPNPNDEFCGLLGYDLNGGAASLNPGGANITSIPTDVTMGHYTPSFLGYHPTPAISENYINWYKPVPPRIAAPDTRSCANGGSGSCKIQHMDTFSIDGVSEGQINIPGGQYKSTIRFYGWAAHNQMPIRKLVVDWGDGTKQALNDAKIKNHKPFCGVTKECSDPIKGLGLTCETNSDCPAGTGVCKDLGLCSNNASLYCRQDSDCGTGGTCKVRTFFGNSQEACETNYFEFTHVYACNQGTVLAPGCDATQLRCSRDPSRTCGPSTPCAPGDACVAGLANPSGCATTDTLTCRFTPRVYVQDNWGWCSGECRALAVTDDVLDDSPTSAVKHPYGGCYSGGTLGGGIVRKNTGTGQVLGSPFTSRMVTEGGECSLGMPGDVPTARPWIVFPGSINLRRSQ